LIKEYLDKNEESAMKPKSKSIFAKREENNNKKFSKVDCKDNRGDHKRVTRRQTAKLHKGDWEDQVEKVENMFKHTITGEWYSLLKW